MDKVTKPTTLQEAIQYFTDHKNCESYMISRRWPNGKVMCPRCGSANVDYLPNARLWKCYEKGEKQHDKIKFSLKVGTIFEDSPLGLDKWLPVVWLIVNAKNGISSWEIHRAIGVTQKTAWFMLHRVRLAMQGQTHGKLSGEVEVDETFIGGKARNMHSAKRREKIQGRGVTGKAVVMGTYISVEPFHLFRYIDEQAWRYNNRKDASDQPMNDADRFDAVISQIVGKRLTYAELIGKDGQTETAAEVF